MTDSKQKRVLIMIIAILLVANIITLFVHFMDKPGNKKEKNHSRKNYMEQYLKNEIGFTGKQMIIYDSLHNKHRKDIESAFKAMRSEKAMNFKFLSANGFQDSLIEKSGNSMALGQKEIEIAMLRHVRDVRNIATADQKIKFDTSFYKLMNREKSGQKKIKH